MKVVILSYCKLKIGSECDVNIVFQGFPHYLITNGEGWDIVYELLLKYNTTVISCTAILNTLKNTY